MTEDPQTLACQLLRERGTLTATQLAEELAPNLPGLDHYNAAIDALRALQDAGTIRSAGNRGWRLTNP